MFKGLIIQRYYNIGSYNNEYQIIDSSSFRKFFGLSSGDRVSDAKTSWSFRNFLSHKKADEKLFGLFRDYLLKRGLIFNEGQIIDASFVEVPRQRNTHEKNGTIKEGNNDTLWSGEPDKKCHKNSDARWTKKNKETHHVYKNCVKVDRKSKLINTYTVTSASPHDSQMLKRLITDEDRGQTLWADSAYNGFASFLHRRHVKLRICEKGYRVLLLTDRQKRRNNKIQN